MHLFEEVLKTLPELSNVQPIAQGGQKTVYKAVHKDFGDVVLKVVLDANDRILREISIAVECDFLNVPELYFWKELIIDGQDIVVLIEQFIPGKTLRDYLNTNSSLSRHNCIMLCHSLLKTAVELEQKNLVHRDIKPENIIWGDDGSFWILDFGIARHLDLTSLTATNARFGPATVGYAAPEQLRNMKKQVDIRADLFSIGVVIFEAITGSNPFIDGARDALEVLQRTESLKLNSKMLQEFAGPELGQFVLVLMEKYASRRPTSAAQALQWFEEIIA